MIQTSFLSGPGFRPGQWEGLTPEEVRAQVGTAYPRPLPAPSIRGRRPGQWSRPGPRKTVDGSRHLRRVFASIPALGTILAALLLSGCKLPTVATRTSASRPTPSQRAVYQFDRETGRPISKTVINYRSDGQVSTVSEWRAGR